MKKFLQALLLLIPLTANAAESELKVDNNACILLEADYHEKGEADYKAGVDSAGEPVVEADIDAVKIALPETVTFPVTVDIAKYMGIDTPKGIENNAVIGDIEVNKQGQVYFNGKSLQEDAQKALKALCQSQKAEK